MAELEIDVEDTGTVFEEAIELLLNVLDKLVIAVKVLLAEVEMTELAEGLG